MYLFHSHWTLLKAPSVLRGNKTRCLHNRAVTQFCDFTWRLSKMLKSRKDSEITQSPKIQERGLRLRGSDLVFYARESSVTWRTWVVARADSALVGAVEGRGKMKGFKQPLALLRMLTFLRWMSLTSGWNLFYNQRNSHGCRNRFLIAAKGDTSG